MKIKNYWNVHFRLDSDRDGVFDYKDCQPFNPRRQDDLKPDDVKRYIKLNPEYAQLHIESKLNDKPWRQYVEQYFLLTNHTRDDKKFLVKLITVILLEHKYLDKTPKTLINKIATSLALKYRKTMPVLTQKDIKNLKLANYEISKRMSYGVREELADQPGIIASWSNGAAQWFPFSDVKKDEIITVDANEMYVPLSRQQFNRIRLRLDPLPLYGLSTEARMRGHAPKNVTEIWALLQKARIEREKGI